MAHYLVGDIQGCDVTLGALLKMIDFSPSRDTLYPLGDLVNRGVGSLQVLRRLSQMGHSVCPILGNHDLHALSVLGGVRAAKPSDTLQDWAQADDAQVLVDWLRNQALARYERGVLLVHAGVLPDWSLNDVLNLAHAIEAQLQAADWRDFLLHCWGNEPNRWQENLTGMNRLRVSVNALTRLRMGSQDGRMELDYKGSLGDADTSLVSWFEMAHRKTENIPIAFGHWSQLGLLQKPNLLGLDTGCVWGGSLSVARLDGSNLSQAEIIQIPSQELNPLAPLAEG